MGGMSILRNFRLADRPHFHSGIFFLLASILTCASRIVPCTCKSEPRKKLRVIEYLRSYEKRWAGRCVGYREQTGVFIFLHVEVRRRAMR